MGGKKKGWASAFTSLFIEVEDGGSGGASGGDEPVDIEALLRETSELTAGIPDQDIDEAPAAPPPPMPSAPPPEGLTIGQPLSELYHAYGVPGSPKTIEAIILFLEGLKGMPQNVQTQALKAMDEADPNWSIADVILDGRYKVEALRKAKSAVDMQVQQKRDQAAAEIADQQAYLDDARKTIKEQIESLHAQIAELMELQQAEENQVEERKAAATQQIAQLEQQALKEHQRIETEIARITRIVTAFGPLAEEP